VRGAGKFFAILPVVRGGRRCAVVTVTQAHRPREAAYQGTGSSDTSVNWLAAGRNPRVPAGPPFLLKGGPNGRKERGKRRENCHREGNSAAPRWQQRHFRVLGGLFLREDDRDALPHFRGRRPSGQAKSGNGVGPAEGRAQKSFLFGPARRCYDFFRKENCSAFICDWDHKTSVELRPWVSRRRIQRMIPIFTNSAPINGPATGVGFAGHARVEGPRRFGIHSTNKGPLGFAAGMWPAAQQRRKPHFIQRPWLASRARHCSISTTPPATWSGHKA